MLSYQHAYHAGGPADVIKHTLWAHILRHMVQKDGALHVYETHAGRGLYDVALPEMQKTPEYKTGLQKIMVNQPESAYMEAVNALNPTGKLAVVPGSPAVADAVLRHAPDTEGDHLHLAEAHPGELEHLKLAFPHAARRARNIHIHEGDGHRLIPTLIKAGQRNAVLIDPSYEIKAEYVQVTETVKAILAKAPQTTVMVWYPLLSPKARSQDMIDVLKALGVPATYLVHYSWNTPEAPGMYGTGQIIFNLPYKLETELPNLLKPLVQPLKQSVANLTSTLLVPRA